MGCKSIDEVQADIRRDRRGTRGRDDVARHMAITIKNEREIGLMREASQAVALVHARIEAAIAPGVTTRDLDDIARDTLARSRRQVALSRSPRLHRPHLRIGQRGDRARHSRQARTARTATSFRSTSARASVDIAAIPPGPMRSARSATRRGICSRQPRRRSTSASSRRRSERDLHAIGHAVEEYATSQGLGLVREYGGHGIGREMWEDPHVPNHGSPDSGPRLRAGMTLAIEPMLNIGGDETLQLDDGWTVITADRRSCPPAAASPASACPSPRSPGTGSTPTPACCRQLSQNFGS